jgi:hypothetical protein
MSFKPEEKEALKRGGKPIVARRGGGGPAGKSTDAKRTPRERTQSGRTRRPRCWGSSLALVAR